MFFSSFCLEVKNTTRYDHVAIFVYSRSKTLTEISHSSSTHHSAAFRPSSRWMHLPIWKHNKSCKYSKKLKKLYLKCWVQLASSQVLDAQNGKTRDEFCSIEVLFSFECTSPAKSVANSVMDGRNSLSIHSFSTEQHFICTMKEGW